MNNGLVSIIVPIYNVEAYLSKCIDSILNQSYTNIEVLLINDGSSDNSGTICDLYEEKDNRVHSFHQNNQGVSFARNVGLNKAKGEWITFVDADDWIDENLISKSIEALIKNNADMAVFDVMHVTKDSEGQESYKPQLLCGSGNDVLCYEGDLAYYKVIPYSALITKLYRRKSIDGLRFDTTIHHGEDLLFLAKAFQRISKIVLIPNVFYYYYQNREGNVVDQKLNPNYLELILVSKTVYEMVKDSQRSHAAVSRCLRSSNIVINKAMAEADQERIRYLIAVQNLLRNISLRDLKSYLCSPLYRIKDKFKILYMRTSTMNYVKSKAILRKFL